MPLKILVVDDETQVLDVVKLMMENLGCEVVTYVDSRKAAEILETQKFDGVLLDVRMPDLDGFELARRIRGSPPNATVPIVMLTGLEDVETMREGFRAGATFFLPKPFTQERAWSLYTAMRGAMLTEKRRHARLPLRTPVRCAWGPYHDKAFTGDSVNISEGGMVIESAGGVDVGAEVELEFLLPQVMKLVRLQGEVLRKEAPDRIAVGFSAVTPEDFDAIRKFIRWGVKR